MENIVFTDSIISKEYAKILELRLEVFVNEFGGSEKVEIFDEDKCLFLGFFEDRVCIGTGRIFIPEDNMSIPRLQRIAVKKDHRRRGIGTRIIKKLEEKCLSLDIEEIEVCARLTALDFYLDLGYQEYGEIFKRDGFDHIIVKKYLID